MIGLRASLWGSTYLSRRASGSVPAPSWVAAPANNIFIAPGDSRQNAAMTVTADNVQMRSLGPHHWVAQALGHRFIVDYGDWATGGATISDCVYGLGTAGSEWGGLQNALATTNAKTCRFVAGVNTWTLTADTPEACAAALAQAKIDTEFAVQIAFNNQCRLIVGEFPSSIYSGTGMTALRQQLSSDYDDYLQTLPARFPWVFYANSYRAVSVNASGPTDILSTVSYDRKHCQGFGAWSIAQAEKAVYQTLFPIPGTVFPLFTSASPAYNATTAPQGSLVTNWMLDDGGVDTAVPTGWTAPSASGLTYTWSRVAGKKRLTITGTPATSGFATLTQNIPAASILLNDVIRFSANVAILAGSTGLVAAPIQLRMTLAGVNKYRSDLDSGGQVLSGVNNVMDGAATSGQLLTPSTAPLNAGADYSLFAVQLPTYHIAGVPVNAVIEYDSITVRKV